MIRWRRTYSSDDADLPDGVIRFTDIPSDSRVVEGQHTRVETVQYGRDGRELRRRVHGVREWSEEMPTAAERDAFAWQEGGCLYQLGMLLMALWHIAISIAFAVVFVFAGGVIGLFCAPPPQWGALIGCLLAFGLYVLLMWANWERDP